MSVGAERFRKVARRAKGKRRADNKRSRAQRLIDQQAATIGAMKRGPWPDDHGDVS